MVFVIDEVGACLDFARGVAAVQEDIYTAMKEFCNNAQLVMAGTAAAGTVASQAVSSKPDQVCLVFVGAVNEDIFGPVLCDAMIKDKILTYPDLLKVRCMQAYLSNARTAVLLMQEVARWVNSRPSSVDKQTVHDAWMRSPHLTSYLVPSKYRGLNGLQKVQSVRTEAVNALKLLMHPALLESEDIPTAELALRCVRLGLVSIPDAEEAVKIHKYAKDSKSYLSKTTFDSSEALKQMILAAFDVPTIVPKDGLSLELDVAEAQRRISEVLTGARSTLLHLPHAMPPKEDQNIEGIPESMFAEILAVLDSLQTVVLINGPSAQGADIILLRRARAGKRPFVRLVQVKNKQKAENKAAVVRTLGAATKSKNKVHPPKARAELVLNWLCRVVCENQTKNLTEQFGTVQDLKKQGSPMNVTVELVLLERTTNTRLPELEKPIFLAECPTFKMQTLDHLAPFSTSLPSAKEKAYGQKRANRRKFQSVAAHALFVCLV